MHGREYSSFLLYDCIFFLIANKKNKIISQTVYIANVSWHILRGTDTTTDSKIYTNI